MKDNCLTHKIVLKINSSKVSVKDIPKLESAIETKEGRDSGLYKL